MEIKEAIADALTEQLLEMSFPKGKHANEWDASDKNSQYSITRELVGSIVDGTFQAIQNWQGPEDELEVEEEEVEEPKEDDLFALPPRDEFGQFQMNKSKGAVKSSAHHFIFMDSGVGNPTYVRDVREWLRRVDELSIPDDQELEGTLHLSYDFDNTDVERIECGECYQHDIITATHHCDGRWSERYEVLKKQRESQQET